MRCSTAHSRASELYFGAKLRRRDYQPRGFIMLLRGLNDDQPRAATVSLKGPLG
jgi:hypothetical protein